MSRSRDWQLVLSALAGLLLVTAMASGQATVTVAPAKLKVYLPANAILHVDGSLTQATGEIRNFVSPLLPLGRKFVYTLRASWKEAGKEVVRERTVRVEAGVERTVDFRTDSPPDEPKDRDALGAVAITPPDVVERMLELAQLKKEDVVFDPRCGDGRFLIHAAKKYGAKGVGIESDEQRVNDAIENVKKNGVANLVSIKKQPAAELDFQDASVVLLHLSPEGNIKLMPQLAKLKAGTRILSDNSEMKGAKPAQKILFPSKAVTLGDGKDHTLYVWVLPWEKE